MIRTLAKRRAFTAQNVARRSFSTAPVTISPEITQALHDNTPVVALESTIITHGFPFPENLAMARQVEQVIRQNGCVPATCAFIDGQPYVGLSDPQIEMLAGLKGANKVSRRDIGATMAQKLHGGTTIAGTMILAHLAGIKVFATGGLGGVHRDGHVTMDVSADLTELGRTPVTVVCAGPKSILDIPRTMEYLETQGVFVGTYNDDGRARVDIPGFFCRSSGVKSPYAFGTWAEIAAIVHNQNAVMGLSSGSLVCVPPPSATSLSSEFMEKIIGAANREAAEKGISGKELTPFLLQKIGHATGGKSVECNREFVMNNAEAACHIARELARLEEPGSRQSQAAFQPTTALKKRNSPQTAAPAVPDRVDTLIIGSVALDTICTFQKPAVLHDSSPGRMRVSVGGVGHNVALAHRYALDNLGAKATCRLVSAVGSDFAGTSILRQMRAAGADTSGIRTVDGAATAQYCASVEPSGELVVACADMAIMERGDFAEHAEAQIARAAPRFVVADCNLSARALGAVLAAAARVGAKVVVEPTSQPKSARLSEVARAHMQVYPRHGVSMLTPTAAELASVHRGFAARGFFDDYDGWFPALDSLGVDAAFRDRLAACARKHPGVRAAHQAGVFQQALQLLPYVPTIVVKLGAHGCVVVRLCTSAADYRSVPTASAHRPTCTVVSEGREHAPGRAFGAVVEYYAVPAANAQLQVANVTGAGDTLLGYLCATLVQDDWLVQEVHTLESEWGKWRAFHRAQLACGKSLECDDAISPAIRTM